MWLIRSFLAWTVDAMETGRCGGGVRERKREREGNRRARARVVRDDDDERRDDETDGLIETLFFATSRRLSSACLEKEDSMTPTMIVVWKNS